MRPSDRSVYNSKVFGAPLQIGSINVSPVMDSMVIWSDPLARYPGTTLEEWRRYELLTPPGDPLIPPGLLIDPITVFLIRSGGKLALVDAGAGPFDYYSIVHVPGGHLHESLRLLGVAPADIGTVILTHLHHDHVGWLLAGDRPFFPNAEHVCHEKDWGYFVTSDKPPYYSAPLAAIKDRFTLWRGAKQPLPGIELIEAPGHTPGNSYVMVSDGDKALALSGDVAHTPIEFAIPGLPSRASIDPVQGQLTRERVAASLPSDALVLGAHFPGMRPGWLVGSKSAREWVPA